MSKDTQQDDCKFVIQMIQIPIQVQVQCQCQCQNKTKYASSLEDMSAPAANDHQENHSIHQLQTESQFQQVMFQTNATLGTKVKASTIHDIKENGYQKHNICTPVTAIGIAFALTGILSASRLFLSLQDKRTKSR